MHVHGESTAAYIMARNEDQRTPLKSDAQRSLAFSDTFGTIDAWLLPIEACTNDKVTGTAVNLGQVDLAGKDAPATLLGHSHSQDITTSNEWWQWPIFEEGYTSVEGETSEAHSSGSSSDAHEDLTSHETRPSIVVTKHGEGAANFGSTCETGVISRSESAEQGRRKRPRRRPDTWTAEDCKKFAKGLKHFNLTEGLGFGGAELMAMYMGNRSVWQIKSHMQKLLKDKTKARAARCHV
jgi:hypothetical protein